jgi:hypothetical protein
MEKVIDKDAVYSMEELQSWEKEDLQELLTAREFNFHHMTGEAKLREMVIASNAVPSAPVDNTPKEAAKTDVVVRLELTEPKKTGTIRVRNYTDREGNLRELKDKNGNQRVVIIREQKKLYLSDDNDRLLYEHLKDHPVYVLGSDACIRLVNTEEQAVDDIDRVELAIDAKNIIKALDSEGLRNFGRVLNIDFKDTTTDAVLKSIMYDEAEEDPEEVLKAWSNPDRETQVLIYNAIEKKVIIKEKGAYRYDGMILGNNFEDCVVWLKQNEQVLPGLRKKV